MKMLRHCYLLVLFLFGAGLGAARAQSFAWAQLARTDVDTVYATRTSATDKDGNTYAYMRYSDNLIAGSITLTGSRYQSSAMVKYDSTGAVVWAKNLSGLTIINLAADNTGGVFMVGTQTANSTNTWDGGAFPGPTALVYYAKCSAAGALQWAQPLPSSGGNSLSMATDNAGAAYIASTVYAASTVSGTTVDALSTFILKTNGAGTTQWVQTLHSGAPLSPVSILRVGPKPGGGCLLSGFFSGTLYLGAGTGTPLVTTPPQNTSFLCNIDAAGTPLWSALVGTPGTASQPYASINGAAADASGNCYITGSSNNGVTLAGVTLPSGFYVAKYDAAGTPLWARGEQAAASNYNDIGLHLAAGTRGVTVLVSATNPVAQPLKLGSLTLRSYYNFVHYTPLGAEQWVASDARTDYSTTTPITSFFVPNSLGNDANGNLYAVGSAYPRQNRFGPVGSPPTVLLGTQTSVGRGTIITRLNGYANTLRGQVYLDQNGNGQQDAAEGVFPRQLTAVLTQGSASVYSAVGADGALQAYAVPGAYTLGIAQLPAHYTVAQPASSSYSGTFNGISQVVAGQDFGLAPIANQADVRVSLTPYSAVRAGFTTSYRLTVENVGTTAVSGTATATLDSHCSYISSTPGGSRVGQAVNWTYANLAPFARVEFDVLVSLPTNVAVGTALLSTAAAPLAADVAPADNTAALAQTVVGAYDPNSIEVDYQRLTPAQVAAQQKLEYTIHFQNLGTAAASTVVLSDTLDYRKLNLASLELVSQSHNCIWSLTTTGPGSGLLTVRFLNINLPERNVDVIRSQGFVRFQVKARNTLAVGEIIPNHAGIVFDYNAPVLTNTATTTVFLASAALARHEAPAWDAYPNPATNAITVAADLATAGPVRVELLDALGRPVRQQSFTAPAGALRQVLDLRGLAAGLYVLRLTPPTGPAATRRVVLH